LERSILIFKKDVVQKINLDELYTTTGVPYLPGLEFINFRTLQKIKKKTLLKEMDLSHRWLSVYFRKELLRGALPKLSLRWVDEKMGWGVFAEQEFQAYEYIAEYAGLVRKRKREDSKNSYCFEYPMGEHSPYIIDAQDMGGISRYVNHSDQPNLSSLSIHVEGIHHIILHTIKKITKGCQLCYDYGPTYWELRPKPCRI